MVDPQIATAILINASSPQEISFGSSSTVLVENLARAVEADVQSDEGLVVSFADHESTCILVLSLLSELTQFITFT